MGRGLIIRGYRWVGDVNYYNYSTLIIRESSKRYYKLKLSRTMTRCWYVAGGKGRLRLTT